MPFPSDTQPDTELFDLLDAEMRRQVTGLQLIASENFTSPAVMRAVGSVLTNKYAEGYPGKRYYGGNAVVDDVEALAIDRAKRLFGADHANVQPHSGANANMCAYQALLEFVGNGGWWCPGCRQQQCAEAGAGLGINGGGGGGNVHADDQVIGEGSGRSNTASTTLKMAGLAPMPRASARITTKVMPGFLNNMRAP